MDGRPTSSPASTRRLLPVVGLVVGGALVVLYGSLQAYLGGGVPRGTTAGAIDIGGLDREAAVARVAAAQSRPAGQPLRVRVGDKTFRLTAATRAIQVDAEATVDAALRGRWNPLTLPGLLFGRRAELVVRIDDAVVDRAIASVARATAEPAVDAGIDMTTSAPSVVPARPGLALEPESARASVVAAVLAGRDRITLRRVEQPAVISTLVAQRTLEQVARPAISESVTVRLAMEDGSERSSVIAPETIRAALTFAPAGALLEPRLDGLVLRRDVDAALVGVQRYAKRAKFRIQGESVTVVPSIEGYGVSAASIADDVVRVLRLTGEARSVTLRMGPIVPAFTTADAEALGIRELVSSYTQPFPAAAYRTINIGTAARYIQGTILRPGETFSMNDTVKERTPENGYTEGWIVGPGGEFRLEQGGAVSTITTAMFNAAWFAGLKLVEHRAHSIYISRYEPGREATVSWGSLDMRFRNNLDNAILITTKLRPTSITVSFWGTKQWPRIGSEFGPWENQRPYPEIRSTDPDCHDQDGQPGFRITVWRTFFDASGVEVKREPYTTNYRPSPHVICVSSGSAKPASPKPPRPRPTTTPKPTASPTPSAETATTA